MNTIVASAELAKQLAQATGTVSIVDANGTVLAVCEPINFPHSPYSREELEAAREEARQHPERGKSIAEVLEQLQRLDKQKGAA